MLRHFPPQSVLCLKSEDLSASPDRAMERVGHFLGVDPFFRPAVPSLFSSPSVQSPDIQKQCRDHFGQRFDLVVEHIRAHGQAPVFEDRADQAAAEALFNNLIREKPKMRAETRRHLQALFA